MSRMHNRENHFMPPELLDSQLKTLEDLQADETGIRIDIRLSAEEIVSNYKTNMRDIDLGFSLSN